VGFCLREPGQEPRKPAAGQRHDFSRRSTAPPRAERSRPCEKGRLRREKRKRFAGRRLGHWRAGPWSAGPARQPAGAALRAPRTWVGLRASRVPKEPEKTSEIDEADSRDRPRLDHEADECTQRRRRRKAHRPKGVGGRGSCGSLVPRAFSSKAVSVSLARRRGIQSFRFWAVNGDAPRKQFDANKRALAGPSVGLRGSAPRPYLSQALVDQPGRTSSINLGSPAATGPASPPRDPGLRVFAADSQSFGRP